MVKIIFFVLFIFICSCGVKNDVIPPDKPWIIFEQSKVKNKKLIKKKSQKEKKKNVNK